MTLSHRNDSESRYFQAVLNDALDRALEHRVRLHAERQAGNVGEADYLAGLAAVRAVEKHLEPLRGRDHTRAWELAMAERNA